MPECVHGVGLCTGSCQQPLPKCRKCTALILIGTGANGYCRTCSVELGGHKDDFGKLRYDLLPTDSVAEIVKVLNYGARKYKDRNWEQGMKWSRPYAALMRHMMAWWSGEDKDPETGLSHLAHAGCCILFLQSYELRECMKQHDDRENLSNRDPRALQLKEESNVPFGNAGGESKAA